MRSQTLLGYLTVLLGAAVPWLEVALVIPAGVAYGLNPVLVGLLACVGNIATLLVLLAAHGWVAERLRRRRERRQRPPRDRSRRVERARRVFDRWGLPGLSLLAPISIGTHTAALLAASLGPSRGRVAVWMTAGILVWAAVITPAAVAGMDMFAR